MNGGARTKSCAIREQVTFDWAANMLNLTSAIDVFPFIALFGAAIVGLIYILRKDYTDRKGMTPDERRRHDDESRRIPGDW
jgi:hypothetical protein